MNAATFALLVDGHHRGDGPWWDGKCPVHGDEHESLSFRDGERGLVLKCHAGCLVEAITRALGLRVGDLFTQPRRNDRPAAGDARARIVATYPYRDERGELLYQVVRFDPKDFRCRRPDGRGGWVWNLDGVRPVPYRLPELAGASRVFIPEGEKDCDALTALGLVATCNHGGAGKWREQHTLALMAAAVREAVVLRDNDRPGAAHQEAAARSCTAGGLRSRCVELPGLPPLHDKHGEDVSDWIAAERVAGRTDDEIRGALLALADAAPVFVTDAADQGAASTVTEIEPELRREGGADTLTPAPVAAPALVRLADVSAEQVSWLWRGRLPRGKLTLIVGDPGLGKSYLTLDVAARVSRGDEWPDGERAALGDVVLLNAEDGLADTIRPRLDALGADTTRVHALRAVRDDTGERHFNLETDLPALEGAVESTRAVLVSIDPLSAYLGARDSYKDAEIRTVLGPLAALAERCRVAVVGIMHLTKDQQRRALYRALGSVAFVAAARVVLAVARDPDDDARRLLVGVKNNLTAPSPGLAFRLDGGRLTWDPGTVDGVDADTLLSATGAGEERDERRDADDFLRDLLADGDVRAAEGERAARANGISPRTLDRARRRVGVRAYPVGYHPKVWWWRLSPKDATPSSKDATPAEVAFYEQPLAETDDLTPASSKDATSGAVASYARADGVLRGSDEALDL